MPIESWRLLGRSKQGVLLASLVAVGLLFLAVPTEQRQNGVDAVNAAAERAAGEATGGKDMGLDAFEQAGEADAARIADQRDTVAAAHQLFRQRGGGDHVAAGAAGGEDEVTRAAHEDEPQRVTYGLRSRNGLRRVKVSSSPMPIDSAIIDEPP